MGGFLGEGEGWDSAQRRSEGCYGPRDGSMGPTGPTGLQGGSIDESEGCDRGSDGWDEPTGGSMGDSTGDSTGGSTGGSTDGSTGDSMGDPTGDPMGESWSSFVLLATKRSPL